MTRVSTDHMNLSEAIERLDSRRRPRRDDLASERNENDESWDLNTDYALAAKFAEFGWQEKADTLDNYMARIERLVDGGWSTHWDVSGECVDVGRYLAGEPECMLNFNLPRIRSVELYANISARCSADAPRLFNRGIAIASAVYALQSSGVAVSLKVGEWVDNRSNSLHETSIEINNFAQYIDPARLAFWLAHPAALRRCIFRYNEQQPKKIRDELGFHSGGGYGRPRDSGAEKLKADGVVYFPFPETDDLGKYQTPEKAFGTIKKLLKNQGIDLSSA